MGDRKIIQNAIQVKDGTILVSRSRHDYQTYGDYSIDGGLDYISIGFPTGITINDITFLTLYEDDSFKTIKSKFVWGTFGKSGKEPLKWVFLKNCETEHLENILKMTHNSPNPLGYELVEKIINSILYDREMIIRAKKIKNVKKEE